MLGPEKDTCTCISSMSELCWCLLSQWVRWDLAEASSPLAEAEKLRRHTRVPLFTEHSHLTLAMMLRVPGHTKKRTASTYWYAWLVTKNRNYWFPEWIHKSLGISVRGISVVRREALGKVWSRRTRVRLWQERQMMTMKDHLYLCAPISLTYLDSCHFHSQASTHSEESSHLFLFAPSHSAEHFVIWPFQPSLLVVPFLNFTVDIVFPVLRGPGRTQFEPVNASLTSSTSRYRTGQETQADFPRELVKPLSLRRHLPIALLRVPVMTATGYHSSCKEYNSTDLYPIPAQAMRMIQLQPMSLVSSQSIKELVLLTFMLHQFWLCRHKCQPSESQDPQYQAPVGDPPSLSKSPWEADKVFIWFVSFKQQKLSIHPS